MNRYLPLILLGVLLNACAQIVLKQGMRNIGHFAFSIQNILPIGVKVALNPFVMIGIFCYVVSVIVWLMVLSRVDVSYAYPLLSVGYIVTAFAGRPPLPWYFAGCLETLLQGWNSAIRGRGTGL